MSAFIRFGRDVAWWLLPLAVLAVILGLELDRGRAASASEAQVPTPPATPAPAATVLPEYAIPGGTDARRETVDRTLFNPTRRPAPAPTVEAPKPQMQRGLYALTGTTVVEGKSTAFLRETRSGRSRRVQEGDTIDGMVVAEVKPDRVRLSQHGESEDLTLKVITNPRPTPQPQVAAAPGVPPGGVPKPAPVPGAPGTGVAAAQPQPADPQTLLERRRAARAAQAAAVAQAQAQQAQGQPPQAPPLQAQPLQAQPPSSPAPAATPQAGQGGWADVYRRYQQQRANPANR